MCPNVKSGDVYVIDPATYSVVDHYQVGGNPQHIIPSWDLKTLWVAGSAERKLIGHPHAHRPEDRQARHDGECSRRL